jgi:hypothetical protein
MGAAVVERVPKHSGCERARETCRGRRSAPGAIAAAFVQGTIFVLNPASEDVARHSAIWVAADANRPLIAADGAQVVVGPLEHLGFALEVDHDIAQQRPEPRPNGNPWVVASRWASILG